MTTVELVWRRKLSIGAVALCCLLTTCWPSPRAWAQSEDRLRITGLELGFDGVYKLGCWAQIKATLAGGDESYTGQLVVRCLDTDGVPTQVASAPDRPVGVTPGQTTQGRLYLRQGRADGRIAVQFIADGKVRAQREFLPGPEPGGRVVPYAQSALSRIVLAYGPIAGLARAVESAEGDAETRSLAAAIQSADDLPLQWYGYESVERVVLSTSQPELYRSLSAGSQRIEALREWVQRGGRLVIFCGANAPELIGPGGPLAGLIPGEFSNEMAPLSNRGLQSIETFTGVGSEELLPRGRAGSATSQAPRLTNVRGRILAFDGQMPEDLPLIIRAREGAGQVTFVALDPDLAPFHDWSARTSFLRQAMAWNGGASSSDSANVGYRQNDDLTALLRSALDVKFEGVTTAPFALVALLVIAYIVWIGPVDYFIVRRLLNRTEATWITFPLFVVIASTAAYWLAHWMKGDQLRVNQVEIVDVDTESGLTRGVVYTHFFSPRVELYDLALEPRFLGQQRPADSEQVVAWLGVPGLGLGGMQGQGSGPRIPRGGYQFSPELNQIIGLPVQEWSTKTIAGRWSGRVESGIEATLAASSDGLLEGRIANRTGVALSDCVLMHGNWAYRLTTLDDGAVRAIDDSLQPRQVSTVLTSAASGDDSGARTDDYGTVVFDSLSTDVARICKTMMFYDVVGGMNYTGKLNRYQWFVDLSDLLDGDQAILLARAPPGSQWRQDDKNLSSDQDRRWTFYRFIIPLGE